MICNRYEQQDAKNNAELYTKRMKKNLEDLQRDY